MSTRWSGIAERAFDFRRAWRASDTGADASEDGVALSDVDALVLSVILQLLDVEHVVCVDGTLRALLAGAFRQVEAHAATVCTAEPGTAPYLLVTPLPALSAGLASDARRLACLVHGVRDFLPCGFAASGPSGLALKLLASSSPALWQCGLALVADPEGRAAAATLATRLADTLRGEWIDPLALLERVQQLSARLYRLGQPDRGEANMRDDRIAQLEDEIRMLRGSALVRQQSLVATASDPASAVP